MSEKSFQIERSLEKFVIPSFVLNDQRPRNVKLLNQLQKSLKTSETEQINLVEVLSPEQVLIEYCNLLKTDGITIEENRALLRFGFEIFITSFSRFVLIFSN